MFGRMKAAAELAAAQANVAVTAAAEKAKKTAAEANEIFSNPAQGATGGASGEGAAAASELSSAAAGGEEAPLQQPGKKSLKAMVESASREELVVYIRKQSVKMKKLEQSCRGETPRSQCCCLVTVLS